jgi:uncharacterized protein YbjT (DUF2867 family)
MVKILVQGASGNTGSAIVNALIAKHADVVAGVHHPGRYTGQAPAVAFDVHNVDQAVNALRDIDVLVLCPPGATQSLEDRYRFATAIGLIVKRARKPKHLLKKQRGLKHVVLLSVPLASTEAILFARQFLAIERAIEATGVSFTVLQLQMFMDNFAAWGQSIQQGKLPLPLTTGKKCYAPIAVADIGEAAANVALNYTAHENKSYTLSGPQQLTADEFASEFSRLTGKPVQHMFADAAATKALFMGAGFPEWQTMGLMELFNLVEQHPEYFAPTNDLEKLLGRRPTMLSEWLMTNKHRFVPVGGPSVITTTTATTSTTTSGQTGVPLSNFA